MEIEDIDPFWEEPDGLLASRSLLSWTAQEAERQRSTSRLVVGLTSRISAWAMRDSSVRKICCRL